MSELLFRQDAYLEQCSARVTAHACDGGVVLDRTVFYPASGGQPGDAGVLEHEGGVCPIAGAIKGAAPDEVVHLCAEGATPPPVGARVIARIDAAARAGFRRVHTALHLLSVVIPAPVTGGQIGAAKGRLDFDLAEAPQDREALEARLNSLIAANLPVAETWITDAELEANPGLVKTMSARPPMGHRRVRLIRIGPAEAPIDLQPCGGTHVRATAEIGPVTLGKIEKKGRQNRRVTLLLGPG